MTTPSPRCERHTRYAAKDELIEDCADCRALAESHAEADAGEVQKQAETDFRDRLASIRRCIPHMADVGGIWPRDVEWLIAELEKAVKDRERLDWLESLAQEREHVEVNYTDAWAEAGEFGSVLSSGPEEFWFRDNGVECGPSLRAAIDAARSATPSPVSGARTTGVGDGE